MSGSHIPRRIYLNTWIALMILLVLTIGAAYVPLGIFNFPVAMLIAVSKAALIILFFMHLRFSNRLLWLAAAAGMIWLCILLALTLTDYATRTG